MLGFPEAQKQHGPRVLAAMFVPRAHASEDEGMRGRKPGSLGSAWQTVASVDLGAVWSYHHIPKKTSFIWAHSTVPCVLMNM